MRPTGFACFAVAASSNFSAPRLRLLQGGNKKQDSPEPTESLEARQKGREKPGSFHFRPFNDAKQLSKDLALHQGSTLRRSALTCALLCRTMPVCVWPPWLRRAPLGFWAQSRAWKRLGCFSLFLFFLKTGHSLPHAEPPANSPLESFLSTH